MPENHVVDHGDIQDGKDGDEPYHDATEEELVAPHVEHPLREIPLRVRLHTEETSSHVDHFPRQEQRKPRHTYERRRPRPEHRLASAVVPVTSAGKVPVAPAEHHQ